MTAQELANAMMHPMNGSNEEVVIELNGRQYQIESIKPDHVRQEVIIKATRSHGELVND